MCGLAGFVATRQADSSLLARMSSAIAHRGPDDSGTWIEDNVGLALRRLAIIDLSSAGHQPMVSTCGRYVIAFNGEIYNYLELRDALGSEGVAFRGHSDTEVLLAAFRTWGRECLRRLNGMWAFAIWDRTEKSLFMSRDRFGKKPLYYAATRHGLHFASEVKSILAAGVVAGRPEPSAIADFASERVSDHRRTTFFEGIDQLAPGSWLELREGRMQSQEYWTPSIVPVMGHLDPSETLSLLEQAVNIRLRSDVPVGMLLSGGIDSSSVTCLAARALASEVHAFSTVDSESGVVEAKGIDEVSLRHPNLTIHRDTIDARSFGEDLDNCLWHQEAPFADGSMVAHFRLMRLARSRGVKVLLTGQGADEIFAGYPGYLGIGVAQALTDGHLGRAWRVASDVRAFGQRLSATQVLGYAMPTGLARRLRQRRARVASRWLDPGVADRISPDVAAGYSVTRGRDSVNEALVRSIDQRTLPGFLHYEDRNSMAHGVETRLPFLDFRLVERILPTPGEEKLSKGRTKAQLRAAVAGIVPDSIVRQPVKTGYPANLKRWLLDAGPERWEGWLDQVKACPLISFAVWRGFLDRFQGGDDEAMHAVWRGLIIALWHRRFCAQAQT